MKKPILKTNSDFTQNRICTMIYFVSWTHNMKKLKTAPQFLEHYAPFITDIFEWDYILKAMRAYAKYQVEREREKLKDELHEEWYSACLEQYNLI